MYSYIVSTTVINMPLTLTTSFPLLSRIMEIFPVKKDKAFDPGLDKIVSITAMEP
ncbi:MAG: hypothetical protein ACJAW3_000868 [Lentimonas sp.]|jgi:hypothetical protein